MQFGLKSNRNPSDWMDVKNLCYFQITLKRGHKITGMKIYSNLFCIGFSYFWTFVIYFHLSQVSCISVLTDKDTVQNVMIVFLLSTLVVGWLHNLNMSIIQCFGFLGGTHTSAHTYLHRHELTITFNHLFDIGRTRTFFIIWHQGPILE